MQCKMQMLDKKPIENEWNEMQRYKKRERKKMREFARPHTFVVVVIILFIFFVFLQVFQASLLKSRHGMKNCAFAQ